VRRCPCSGVQFVACGLHASTASPLSRHLTSESRTNLAPRCLRKRYTHFRLHFYRFGRMDKQQLRKEGLPRTARRGLCAMGLAPARLARRSRGIPRSSPAAFPTVPVALRSLLLLAGSERPPQSQAHGAVHRRIASASGWSLRSAAPTGTKAFSRQLWVVEPALGAAVRALARH